jgi:hypothetical protein
MLFREELVFNLMLTLAETAALLWSGFLLEWSFKQLFFYLLGINFALQTFWDLVIYPYAVSPLRHLPRVGVCTVRSVSLMCDTELTFQTGTSEPGEHRI